jgi:lipopolysaccharide transport system permease protein/teichoic acid transport system permease protein
MTVVNEAPAAFRSSADRPGPLDLILGAVRDIHSRRRLIGYMVRAEVKKKGTDTVLGNVWWVLDPLITMLVYVLVMTVIFERSTPDFPLFLLSAMVPFKWFTATVASSTGAVTGHERLIKQILFPKVILPVTEALSQIVSFLFGMLVLGVVLLIAYPQHLSIHLAWLPVIAVVQFTFVIGLTFLVSSITVFYRDVGIVIGHLMRLLFWVSPILWSFHAAAGRGQALREAIGETGFALLSYNPVALLLDAYRTVIYGGLTVDPAGKLAWTSPTAPDLPVLGLVSAIGLIIATIGILIFKRLEPAFAKVL